MSNKYTDIKLSTTVSVIIHGGSPLGFKLAKTLLEQGGQVILIDHFNSKTKGYVSELKKLGKADFIDFTGLEALYKNLSRIDYIYYLLSEKLDDQNTFSSRDFLEESNYLNQTLKSAQKSDSKVALVSSIKLNEQLSAHILNSNVSAPSPYSAIELQKYCETLTAEYRDKSKLNARIIRLGSILGAEIDQITDPILDEILEESSNKGFITIYGEGLELHYLINIEDAVYGILKITFQSKTEGEVISLTNNNDYTTLSLAYKILEINDDISDIKFAPARGDDKYISYEHYIPAPNASNFGWKQGIVLEQSIIETIQRLYPKTGQIISKKRTASKSTDIETVEKVQAKSVKTPLGDLVDSLTKPFTRITRASSNSVEKFRQTLTPLKFTYVASITVITLLAFFYLIYPILSLGFGGYLTYKALNNAKDSAVVFELDKSQKELEKAQGYIEKISKSFNQIKWVFTVSGQTETFDNFSQLLFASQYGVSGAKDVVEAIEPLSNYINNFEPALNFQNNLPASSREYRDDLVKLKQNKSLLQKGVYSINIASDLIDSVKTSSFPTPLQNYVVILKQYNDNLSDQITPAEKVITFLPDVLGIEKRVRYLVLLQNPAELRSTGGWLSSYALISFEGGQIRELKVDDIYNLDGNLINKDIKIQAPTSMRNALDVELQTFSLSNWIPDLQSVAALNEQLLGKTDPGTEIDGVIAIDTEVLKALLSVWDEVIIPGESQPITAENLDEKILKLHKEFTPGESLKAPFLANLANTLFQRVLSSDAQDFTKLGDAFLASLESKNMSIYLENSDAYDYLDQNGWSGTLGDKYKSAPFTVEWNWGANKVNSKIERSINLNIDIFDEKKVDYTYQLSLKNSATTKVYPLGDYTNYLRVYLPEGAQIKSVKGFSDADYQIYLENGFKVVGGWLNVPIQSSKTFDIKYTLEESSAYKPISVSQNDIEYNLNAYKQPGTYEDTISINITYPDTWAVINADGLDNVLNQLILQSKFSSDMNYQIVWNRK